eukprot:203668-Pleurochrysis_carterae.AAC.1
MLEREFSLDTLSLSTSQHHPWRPAFHIDSTSISARRGFTHSGITLGSLFRDRHHVQSELKLMTLAVGRVKDNAERLRHMLGDGISSGIAADIHQLSTSGVVFFDASIDGSEWVVVGHCQPTACLDLAAARGMRACRGKSACLCGCAGAASLQSYPGNGKIAAIPDCDGDGDALAEWRTAEAILRSACSFKSELMEYSSLEAAGH